MCTELHRLQGGSRPPHFLAGSLELAGRHTFLEKQIDFGVGESFRLGHSEIEPDQAQCRTSSPEESGFSTEAVRARPTE